MEINEQCVVALTWTLEDTQGEELDVLGEPVEFLVAEKTMELKEVVVKAPKVRQLGDTIHYDVASFMDETDRTIGDVLKKLPGVQVLSSGQILYQNKDTALEAIAESAQA